MTITRWEGYTPKQIAHEIAIGWLVAAYHEKTGDLGDEFPPHRKRLVKAQIAKLHARLVAAVGFDALPLKEDDR